jgi:transposase
MARRTPELREQQIFLPELISERVEQGPHAARFFQYLARNLNLKLQKASALGTPEYCRTTLLAGIFYAMYRGYFGADEIHHLLGDSIGAQWIMNGMTLPSSRTIDRIIDDLLLEIEDFYIQILQLCGSFGLVGGELFYIDGTKKQANASKHKAMSYGRLNKKIGNGKETLKTLFKELKSIADGLEELTDEEYESMILRDAAETRSQLLKSHKQDLAERQEGIFNIDSAQEEPKNKEAAIEKLKNKLSVMPNVEPENQDKAVEMLADVAFTNSRVARMEDAKSTLESQWKEEKGNVPIPDTRQINFTDPDSRIMLTKNHGVQQAYNHIAIIDAKANIIVGTFTSNSTSDQLGLIPAAENTKRTYGGLAGSALCGDAGFFSADNIAYAIKEGIDFYASYPEAKSPYAKDKFAYDGERDVYICPTGSILTNQGQPGSDKCKYSNEDACKTCPNRSDCAKANDGVRKIERNMVDDKLRDDAKAKAQSEIGKEILKQRKHVAESGFGNMKTQDEFIQMHFRGIEKSGDEFDLRCAFRNIRKLFKVYMYSKSFQDAVHNSELKYHRSSA